MGSLDLNKKAMIFVFILLLIGQIADASFFGVSYSHSGTTISHVQQ